MLLNSSTAITPDRRTVVTFDTDDVGASERTVFLHRDMLEIANPSDNGATTETATTAPTEPGYNVVFMPEHGWTLRTQIEEGDKGTETTNFDAGVMPVTVTPTTILKATYRANDDLPGVTLGSNQRASGYEFYQKSVSIGQAFDDELAADAAAFAPPSDIGVQPLKRIAVSDDELGLDDRIEYQLVFYIAPQTNLSGERTRIYFGGPAGHTPADPGTGTGNYVLRLLATGWAHLEERIDTGSGFVWLRRKTFQWTKTLGDGMHSHRICIYTDAVRQPDGTFKGTKILIDTSFGKGYSMDSALVAGEALIKAQNPGKFALALSYAVPSPETNTYQPCKFRIDDRVDTRSEWRITKGVFFREGWLLTKTFDIKTVVSDAEPLYLQWFGSCPPTCTVTIRMFDAETGTELTGLGPEVSYDNFGYKGFDPTSGRTSDTVGTQYTRRMYYGVLELTSDGSKSPVIRTIRPFRHSVPVEVEGTRVEAQYVQSISITGQDSDPSHETAMIQLSDLTGDLSILQLRAQIPMRIDVRYDPEDDTNVSTLFTGYVARADRRIKGGSSKGINNKTRPAYPVDNWAAYSVRCTGEWQRLQEAVTSQLWNFSLDVSVLGSTPVAWKITDIIATLLKDAGYGDDQILVPDLPLRLFTSGDSSENLKIEPFSPVYPIIAQLALSYLGGWIHWDANASGSATPTKMGAWRLSIPGKPVEGVFKTLAHFKNKQNPVGTALRWGYSVDAQAVETGMDDQPIKTVWIRKGSVNSYVVPPEANMIVVSGVGLLKSPAGAGALSVSSSNGEAQITQVAINYESALFDPDQPIDPNPDSPDFLGRIVRLYYGDSGLSSPDAVNFACRRLYDMVCHAQKRISFEAPLLLVTDVTDEYQRQPRPLRYGDMVKYEGENFIVASCNPDYSGGGSGRRMMAVYELFSPSPLSLSGTWAPRGQD